MVRAIIEVTRDTDLWISASGQITLEMPRSIRAIKFTINQLMAGRLMNFGCDDRNGFIRHHIYLYVHHDTKEIRCHHDIEDIDDWMNVSESDGDYLTFKCPEDLISHFFGN